ncbi:MAG: PKD domain-containing protein [Bacteroidia bacterium]
MRIWFLLFASCLMFGACKKSNEAIPYGSSINYSNLSSTPTNAGGAFSFTKITISPNPLVKGTASKVIATATGNNLTYTWTTSHGELFGSGSAIYYSDSCVGTYTITCVVSDGTHSATITVSITITN